MNEKESLLVEIRTEELPPAQLWELADSFPDSLLAALQKIGFADNESARVQRENGEKKKLATPRRLAAQLSNISAELSPQEIMRRGPQMSACKDADGAPTKALIGFMQSVGATCENDLTTVTEKGKEYIAWHGKSAARKLADELAIIVERALFSIPSPRLMRWEANEFKFIRPVRGILLLHGKKHISGKVMGISATKTTKGHPFMSTGDVEIADVDSYVDALKANKVIVDIDERLEKIAHKMEKQADQFLQEGKQKPFDYDESTDTMRCKFLVLGHKWEYVRHFAPKRDDQQVEKRESPFDCYAFVSRKDPLLREVCAMCEYPVVHQRFSDERFKNLPWQCIAECMQKHQRFLPINVTELEYKIPIPSPEIWLCSPVDFSESFMGTFYFVVADNAPTSSEDQASMLRNYDTVLRARLSDVLFYYEEDKKIPLSVYVEKLKTIVFHKKLGSQYDRIGRVHEIAKNFKGGFKEGEHMSPEIFLASLPTKMVGEYPNLQEVMSNEYFGLAYFDISVLYGLEKLVGLFGVGEIPTGSKDPHGLRKEAMAYVQGNVFYNFPNPREIIDAVTQSFADKIGDVTEDVYDFFLDRFRVLLSQQGYISHGEWNLREAVLSQKPESFWLALEKILAIQKIQSTSECWTLAAANKRINNILRKSQIDSAVLPSLNSDLFSEDAERDLYGKLCEAKRKSDEYLQPKLPKFSSILEETVKLAPFVDTFFDKVLVNHEDEKIRLNRFALLAELRDLLNTVGDLSYLAK